jgi:K+-sensing histidine kinase KdpD
LSNTTRYKRKAHQRQAATVREVPRTTRQALLRALAERLRTPLFASGGALSPLSRAEQSQLQAEASKLADVCQRSSSNVEGRNGYLSLRNHQLRGLRYHAECPQGADTVIEAMNSIPICRVL